nr:hypothetical protein [Tanacetum cinerariifolium]
VDEGFLVGYSVSSKVFRVFNSRIRIVQETLHVNFLENKPNVAGSGPTWLFDIDTLTKTMNYQPSACVQDKFDAEKAGEEGVQQYVFFPVWSFGSTNPQNTNVNAAFDEKEPEFEGRKPESKVNVSPSSSAQSKKHDDKTKREAKGKSPDESLTGYRNLSKEFEYFSDNSINEDNATDTSQLPDDPNMPELEDITYSNDENDVGVEADFNNLETSIIVSPISTIRVHEDHHVTQIIGDLSSATQTRSMTRVARDQEPKRVHQALKDPSWIEAMQEKLLQFKMHKEEGIDYEEVLAPVARIEAIRLFLAYASFMGFMVYQMDVKSTFLYGTIEEEVYVCQPPGFEDPDYPDKVYKVVKEIYGLHQAPRAWYETLANYLLENGFQRDKIDQTLFIKRQKGDILLVQIYMSSMGELTFFLGLQVKQKKDGIFISQDKYIAEILRKFGLTDGKSASTPIDTEKPLPKDPDGDDVVKSGMESLKKTLHVTNILNQTVSDKDSSNPLMADNLPKIEWYSTHHVALMKSWLVQKQTALGQTTTGKEISNPFMAGVNTPRCDEDRLELIKLTVFLLPSDEKVEVEVSDVDLQKSVAVKKVNDVTRLQALVDKKKVIITEASIRDALRLDDAEGVECLPNEEFFTELARMGYEKPSTKLTFYKAFFSS